MDVVAEPEVGGMRRAARRLLAVMIAASFVVGIVGLMMFLAGVFEPKVKPGRHEGTERQAGGPDARDVEVVQIVRRPRRESAVGTIRAVYEAVVASKILARVEEVRVKAGQEVQRGDVMVVLDKADLKSRMDQARSAETAATAKYEQAEIDQGRLQRLRTREAVTQSELDLANTALRTAKAELQRARQAVEEARITEGYATVRAPISGRVIDKKINAGDTVSPGQVMVTMYDPSHMQMVVTVRESLALRLKVGQKLPARLDAIDFECLATVSEIVPEAQAESRSFQVKVTGPCPPEVYSGMFGRVFIPLEDEDILTVPSDAIRHVGQLDLVDVVEGNVVNRRAVQLGRALEDGREVLSGLKAGEKVLRQKGSRPGTREGQS